MVTDVQPNLPAPGPQILLCDDSAAERQPLAHYLRRAGYLVDEASDGDSALRYLKSRRADLVLLDLHMPAAGSDGFDVLNYIQQRRRGMPVILLSGMPPDQIQHKMHNLQTRELPPLLLKPVDPEQLLQVVDLHLAGQLPTGEEPEEDAPGSLPPT